MRAGRAWIGRTLFEEDDGGGSWSVRHYIDTSLVIVQAYCASNGGRVEFAELDNRKGSRSKLVTGYRFQLDQDSRERNIIEKVLQNL